MKRISPQAITKAFQRNMYDADGYFRIDWNEKVGKNQIAQAQLDSCEKELIEVIDWLDNGTRSAASWRFEVRKFKQALK